MSKILKTTAKIIALPFILIHSIIQALVMNTVNTVENLYKFLKQ